MTTDEELINITHSKPVDIGIEAAWAGGNDGCSSVTNSLIKLLPQILSSLGNYLARYYGTGTIQTLKKVAKVILYIYIFRCVLSCCGAIKQT